MVSITKKEYERLLKESKTYNTYSASQKKYREANKQYYKDYHKKWQEENRERIREYQKAWRQQKKLVDSAKNQGNISNDKGSEK